MDGGAGHVVNWDKVGCEMLLLACNTEPLRCILRAQCHVYYYDVFEHQSTIVLCSSAKSSCFIHACKILIGRPVESVYNRDLRLIESHTCVSEEPDASDAVRLCAFALYLIVFLNCI